MKTRTMILCALFAALTAVGAFFKIPFALAAISLQFLFTAMAGVLLGAGYGALSQAVYVLIGLVGVPIFALGGGFSYIFQPTFGFLLGLIPCAFVIGKLAKRPLTFWRTALSMLAGLAVLYADSGGYSLYLHHVYHAIATRNQLTCGIAYAVYPYGEDSHTTGGHCHFW